MSATSPSQARINAAIAAARDHGLTIAEVRIERDGALRILTGGAALAGPASAPAETGANTCDAIFGDTD